MNSEPPVYRLLGQPEVGGILIVADHASNRVPDGVALSIAPDLMTQHMAIDIGVAGVAERMIRPGTAAYLANVSRLVCDFNRYPDSPGVVPEASDGHAIPGNVLSPDDRADRIARYFTPYHAALTNLLDETEPALIISLHSFTPRLASDPHQQRPWQVGVLYNQDDRVARVALAMLEAEGLVVGDQQPYSGKTLNATMNRHAEAQGRPYLGVEIRQDQIGDEAGQALWATRLTRIVDAVTQSLS